MSGRRDTTVGNDGEFRYAVGAQVGYCLAGAKLERLGTVVEVDEHFVTVRDAQHRNEVRVGKADSIRVVQAPDAVTTTAAPGAGPKERPCKRCGLLFAPSSVQRKSCPACKAELKLEYQRAWRAKQGHGSKSVAARAKSAAPTAAAQDNPQPHGGMVLVRTPRVAEVPAVPAHAPSTANVDPYDRALTAEPPAPQAQTMSAELQGIAAQCVMLSARLERLEAALKGLL
jgi:hypothetical protein